jgi:hypothetical protein
LDRHGKIGIGNERMDAILFEVVRPDDSINKKNDKQVLDKWANDFHGLLNTNDENDTSYEMQLTDSNLNGLGVGKEIISVEKTYQAILQAKFGK